MIEIDVLCQERGVLTFTNTEHKLLVCKIHFRYAKTTT